MEERLQKYLAQCGVASRRKCEELILQGRVQVNGVTVTELGTKINPEKDKIKFDGKDIKQAQKLVYILLNKPIGYVTTADDQFGRDTVLDLVKVKERIVPVGRLDMYTSGALILTNDGDFVYQVTHPKHEIEKTYTVTIKGIVQNSEVEQLRNGIKIDDYITKPARVKILKTDTEKDISRLEINAVATDKEAKIEIMGNENLQQGENTITVIVKNEKTNQTVTYKITVNKNVVSETKVERNFFFLSTWGKEMIIKSIIVAVLILLIIIAVVLKVKISKEAKLENGNDNHDDIDFPGANELNKAIAEHQELSENNEKNEESKAKKYVENDAKTEEKMKKIDAEENDANASGRRKGKHF